MILEGSLDYGRVERLWKKRAEIFSDGVADMSAVDKIDSAGVAFLVVWAKHRKLTLVNPPAEAKNLISLFRLGGMFAVEETAGGNAAEEKGS